MPRKLGYFSKVTELMSCKAKARNQVFYFKSSFPAIPQRKPGAFKTTGTQTVFLHALKGIICCNTNSRKLLAMLILTETAGIY